MAEDDASARIDQAFAEGSLIDEAIEVAAAEAIERHRLTGVPLAISQADRVASVSAERIDAHDTSTAIVPTVDELRTRRSAKDLLSWFDESLGAINSCPSVKRQALLHQGMFKQFYEEMYPFALFVRHLYADRTDVFCALGSIDGSNRDYDAVVERYDSAGLSRKDYVELTTTAFDRNESLRMRHFLKHSRVSAFGRVHPSGEVENEFVRHDELRNRAFDGINRRVRGKAKFQHGPDHVLVVSFDDWLWFGTASDVSALRSSVNAELQGVKLNVRMLYVLGLSGRTFLEFPISSGER